MIDGARFDEDQCSKFDALPTEVDLNDDYDFEEDSRDFDKQLLHHDHDGDERTSVRCSNFDDQDER